MKKQISYLILLSLMACKKPDCTGDAVTPLPIEEPKKPPLVDCKLPTRNRDTAQTLIVGKWRLTRVYYIGFSGIFTSIAKEKEELVFNDNGTVNYFYKDTLKLSSPYKFIRLSETSNIMKDSSKFLLKMEKIKGYGLQAYTTFEICDDSLYLLFNQFFYDATSDKIYSRQK